VFAHHRWAVAAVDALLAGTTHSGTSPRPLSMGSLDATCRMKSNWKGCLYYCA
jgi:hypothetical protein